MFRSKTVKNRILKTVSFILALAVIAAVAISCKPQEQVEDPILECDGQAIPLSFYEFLLSRMKGTLARNKYDVKSDSFWESEAADGLSYEEYFNSSILDSCKNYLAALVIFEEEGLELPKSKLQDIEEEIAFYISYDGDDSEEKFNQLIEEFGVDVGSLRDSYTIEAKYEYLISYLYGNGSLIADTVKEEYYSENYYRFKQILITNFYYEYEEDEQGNIIYFDTESGERVYDKANGSFIYDENGNKLRDDDGKVIYFDADGKILYDTENGQPSVILDENGEAKQYFYTDEQMKERKDKADGIFASLSKGNYAAFESNADEINDLYMGEEIYSDGYYFSDIESSGYEDHMLDILEALKDIECGEYALVESDYGYHIIMRYELDGGKYSDSKYSEWFNNFNASLINKLFLDKSKKVISDLTEIEENIEKARSIRDIGINFDY